MDSQVLIIIVVKFLAGLTLLTVGAEGVVRGGSRLAGLFGIPPLIIGLTIVSIGTSAPELAVSLDAALREEVDITLGNIIGSNIANLLLIVGLCAVIAPLPINRKIVSFDTPFLIAISGLTCLFAFDSRIGLTDGSLLLVLLVAYTSYLIRRAKTTRGGVEEHVPDIPVETIALESTVNKPRAMIISIAYLIVGGGMLTYGADLFVSAASQTAQFFGVSQLVIGLTVVAVGTSLPEVATSVLASVRGELDIAVGNVVGSCIFNLLFVLGAAAVIHPIQVGSAVLSFDLPIMFFVTLGCWPIFLAFMEVSRGEGVLMLSCYLAYLLVVVLQARQSAYYDGFVAIIGYGVLPLIAIYLIWRAYISRHIWLGAPPEESGSVL